MKKKLLVASLALLVTGCASSPEKIQSAYVSPLTYKDYDCDQISGEMERVSRRANDLHASIKKTADGDSAQMAVGMILFWPALFFLEGGDGPEAAEYGRLKGEREALEKVAVQKRCNIVVPPAQAPAIQEVDGTKAPAPKEAEAEKASAATSGS